jgi:histidyl-tRNA synthetase
LSDIGGAPMSGVGLGFGDVVIAELLAGMGRKFDKPGAQAVAVGYLEDAQQPVAMAVAQALRKSGKQVDLALKSQKARSFFSRAGSSGYAEAVFIGPDDVANGSLRIKDLVSRTERTVPLSELQAR